MMEVVAPLPEFHFHASVTAPSSPPNLFSNNKTFFDYRHVSAPTSPTAAAAARRSTVPFGWEEKPVSPKSHSFDEEDDGFDFAFAFAYAFRGDKAVQQPPMQATASADELFESGKIRPLKLPPRLYVPVMGEQSPKSPRSGGLLSPLRRGRNQRVSDVDPFAVAMLEATKSRRGSRSLSPFRSGGKGASFQMPGSSSPESNPPPIAGRSGRGWKSRLKELLPFRSSPELRAVTVEKKKRDLCKSGSSSSASSDSASSDSASSDSSSTAAVTDKKMVVPYKQSMLSIRSFTVGQFGTSFIRGRT